MENFKLTDYISVHFIGIGGVSMSALAKYCLSQGYIVSGSDRTPSPETEELKKLGATVFYGHSAKNVNGAGLAVYTSALSEDNPELVAAKKKGIPVIKRSFLLGNILKKYKKSIAVSGSHGKTTVTAMLTDIFVKNESDPAAFIGGDYPPVGNFRLGSGDVAVAEACEYKKNFLDIKPYAAVVLNIDDDHKDSFNGEADEIAAFSSFIGNSLAVINADDKNAAKLFNSATVNFGIDSPASYTARRLSEEKGFYSFDLYAFGKKRGEIKLKIRGKHNVYNALAAFAAADIFGVPFATIKSSLEDFGGVKRRNEFLGKIRGSACFADYAHHPSEISALLDSYKDERVTVVFQPHTYSRTKYLKEEFVKALSAAEKAVIYKTYPARENYDEAGDGKRIYEGLRKEKGEDFAFYADSPDSLFKELYAITADSPDNVLLFVGAGDIYSVAKALCEKR